MLLIALAMTFNSNFSMLINFSEQSARICRSLLTLMITKTIAHMLNNLWCTQNTFKLKCNNIQIIRCKICLNNQIIDKNVVVSWKTYFIGLFKINPTFQITCIGNPFALAFVPQTNIQIPICQSKLYVFVNQNNKKNN